MSQFQRHQVAIGRRLELTAVAVSTRERNKLVCSGCEVAASRNLYLGTFRVELRGHRVEGDGLKADQVVSRRHRLGNCSRPARVLRNHLPSGPLTIVYGTREEACLINLEPLQCVGIDSRAARAGALREVRQLKIVSMVYRDGIHSVRSPLVQ